MNPVDRNRMLEAMAAASHDQTSLAAAVGCTPGAINQILGGTTLRSRFLGDIAQSLRVSVAWLRNESDTGGPGSLPQAIMPSVGEMADQLDVVMVPEVDLEYGMGGGTVLIDDPETRPTPFPRAWLEAITYRTRTPVEKLAFARGRGDSMTPTILDGDIVMIDRSQHVPREQDRIWACAWGELGAIKRVRRSAGGGFLLMSDNPVVRDEQLADDELHVVGRVIWIGRTV